MYFAAPNERKRVIFDDALRVFVTRAVKQSRLDVATGFSYGSDSALRL